MGLGDRYDDSEPQGTQSRRERLADVAKPPTLSQRLGDVGRQYGEINATLDEGVAMLREKLKGLGGALPEERPQPGIAKTAGRESSVDDLAGMADLARQRTNEILRLIEAL